MRCTAVDCTGSRQPRQPLGHLFCLFFIVGFGSTVFFGPPFPEYIRSRYTVVEHRVARWLQIKRHSIDAGDTRANWTTARDPEPQRRRSKTLLPPFLSETNGLREGARACGHPIPSQPGPDPTWGGRQRGGGARRLGFWKAWDSGGGPHPPISQPLSHCTVLPTVPLPLQGPPSRARSWSESKVGAH